MAAIRTDWYLKDWLRTLRISQSALAERLDWQNSKVSRLVNGTSDWNREHLEQVATALHLQPFELLLHPEDAMSVRRMRDSALVIAADKHRSFRFDLEPINQPTSKAG